jgi:hypothetical protein
MTKLHHWFLLKDKEGRPINNASINLYLAETYDEATVYSSTDPSASSLIDQSTWITGASGYFDFYIGDQFESADTGYVGYDPDQLFDLYWAASGTIYSTDPRVPSGVIDNIQLLPKLYQVDEVNRGTRTVLKNKFISNNLAYDWNIHPNLEYSTFPHDIDPVDYTDGSDVTFNKVVNNDVIKRMVSFPIVSAGDIQIATSGALISQHTLYASAWSPSGDTNVAIAFEHNLAGRNNINPIVQVYEIETQSMITPVDIRNYDDDTLLLILASGDSGRPQIGNVHVTVLGEIQPRVTAV